MINLFISSDNRSHDLFIALMKKFDIFLILWTMCMFSLDSRYSSSRSLDCTYDCEITEVLTLNAPSCTDTGNKYSLYAENEKGNSTTNTTYYSVSVSCKYSRIFLAHLSQRLKWAFLIRLCPLSHFCFHCCKLFTFLSLTEKPLSQYQPNLAQRIFE